MQQFIIGFRMIAFKIGIVHYPEDFHLFLPQKLSCNHVEYTFQILYEETLNPFAE